MLYIVPFYLMLRLALIWVK